MIMEISSNLLMLYTTTCTTTLYNTLHNIYEYYTGLPIVIDAQDNDVYIAWIEIIQNKTGLKMSSIYFTRSNNNGTSFDPIKRIGNVSGEITNLEMKSFKNNLYIIWNANIESKPHSSFPLYFDLSIKMSSDYGQSFLDKKSIIKSNSFPLGSKLFVQQYDFTILTIYGNDILMSKNSGSVQYPFDTSLFTNATDIEFLGYGNGLNILGLNPEGKVYAISANNTGIRLNIFSPSYTPNKKTQDLGSTCPTVKSPSSYDFEILSPLSQSFRCGIKLFANNLLKTFEPKIQENIINPLEHINSNNSKISNLSSDIRTDLKRFPQLFDCILSKQYALFFTLDGRSELQGMLTNQSNQFWNQYKAKIDNETQQLISKINNLNNETDSYQIKKHN